MQLTLMRHWVKPFRVFAFLKIQQNCFGFHLAFWYITKIFRLFSLALVLSQPGINISWMTSKICTLLIEFQIEFWNRCSLQILVIASKNSLCFAGYNKCNYLWKYPWNFSVFVTLSGQPKLFLTKITVSLW